MKSAEIRQKFLQFFEERGHRIVASHGLIPPADPTLLFVNAGMVQFKDVFAGYRDPGYRRATTTQKCLRVSGKHNDLDEVGRTPRHHTFFEMLGNFSFGDYFKRDAIVYAWDLLTKVYGLDPADLWVTVHPDDDEARQLWITQAGVAPDRIIADPDDFWSMGDTGPCGPCSEIYVDRGPSYSGTSMHDQGHRFMEIWNLVFMQFNRDEAGVLHPLPAPSIDTGMGLERIASVLQGVRTNYDTDLLMPLIERAAAAAGIRYGQDPDNDTALRVIADHARATAFLISDGVFPENEGRGYVLRRLMRRALRFGHKLGFRGPFFTDIVLFVSTVMGSAWPELQRDADVIARIAGQEEERFLKTLSSGMELLDAAVRRAREEGRAGIDGQTVFTLYDTHGFPVDLTEVVAEENGMGIDRDGFNALMEEQRARGRASWKTHDASWGGIAEHCRVNAIKSEFVGYDYDEAAGNPVSSVVAAIFVDGSSVESASAGADAVVVCRRTPFYAESGGQVGDTGTISGEGYLFRVSDTRKQGDDCFMHVGKVESGVLKVGHEAGLVVNRARLDTRRNHSTTHLLHRALRQVLGTHVRQRGSQVSPERLRFDFSHMAPMTRQEIEQVEKLVQGWIFDDLPIVTREMPIEAAIAEGALHFFEDKYGESVRMVRMGDSVELCGGTHAARTSAIGLFKIVSEGGISAGVRRIEALTGSAAVAWFRERDRMLAEASEVLRCDGSQVAEKASRLVDTEKSLRKELADLKVKVAAAGSSGGDAGRIVELGGIKVMVVPADGMDRKGLRELADVMRDRVGSGMVLITVAEGAKMSVVLAVSADLQKERPAGTTLNQVLAGIGGRGGGSPSLAQGSVDTPADRGVILDALAKALQ